MEQMLTLDTRSVIDLGLIKGTDTLMSDSSINIFQWITYAVICQFIDVFGITGNVINIVCFVKQGFKEPVNVSLLGLAVTDIGCLVTLIWTNICYTPPFGTADLPFDYNEFQYLTSGMAHVTFARVSSWITAIITLERCLCIAMPLKVKDIVTSKRIAVAIVVISILLIASVSPLYTVNKLAMKFFPKRNKTLLGLVFTGNRENVEKVSFTINNVFIPLSAFLVIIVCTVTLSVKLMQKSKWRTKSTISNQAAKVSTSNLKVVKMVVMISTLFIVCFTPISVIYVAMAMLPQLTIDGEFRNVLILTGGLGFLLESINSSVNIFIYYNMSSKYKEAFQKLFKCCYDSSAKVGSA